MAIVKFGIDDIQAHGIDPKGLDELIEKLGVEIESKNGNEIELNITPNRPDLLDFYSFVRALKYFSGKNKPKEKEYSLKTQPIAEVVVTDEVKKVRPYIAALVVKNLKLTEASLKYVINFTEKLCDTYGRRRKKIAIGLHNLDAIVGTVVYDASHDGVFAALNSKNEMSFEDLIKSHPKGIEYSHAIPDAASKKTKYPHIKDSKKILALIPITNADATKVTDSTKSMFIDITGTSEEAINETAAILACTFADIGCEIYPVTIKYPGKTQVTPVLEYKEVKVMLSKAEKTLGVEIGEKSVASLGNRMGYNTVQSGGAFVFSVPPYRVDVFNEQDVIEDLAIAYGYDNITPDAVVGSAIGHSEASADNENRIALFMLGLGYTEAINSTLTNQNVNANFDSVRMEKEKNTYVTIADSKSAAITMMRKRLLPGLLDNLSVSLNAKMPQRLFEIGRVYSVENGKIMEAVKLSFVSEHSKANFSEIKSDVEALLKQMGIKYTIETDKGDAFIEGRYAEVKHGSEKIGGFGEIHPQVLQNFGLEEPVVAAFITIVNSVNYEA